MTSFRVLLAEKLGLQGATEVNKSSHSGMTGYSSNHTGFDKAVDSAYRKILGNQQSIQISEHRFGTVSEATAKASSEAVSRALTRIARGMNSTQLAIAAVDDAKHGMQISFHDAEFRKELHNKIAKKGGRIGSLVTGEQVLADWIISSKPNNSTGTVVAVPGLERTLRQNKNPDDRVANMLRNIAAQGYVLQQAKGKTR